MTKKEPMQHCAIPGCGRFAIFGYTNCGLHNRDGQRAVEVKPETFYETDRSWSLMYVAMNGEAWHIDFGCSYDVCVSHHEYDGPGDDRIISVPYGSSAETAAEAVETWIYENGEDEDGS